MDARVAARAEVVDVAPRQFAADHFKGIEKFEGGLWKIADNLRANSNLASNEYFMPIMGLIFLRQPRTDSMRPKRRSSPTRGRARCRIVRWSRPISPVAAP